MKMSRVLPRLITLIGLAACVMGIAEDRPANLISSNTWGNPAELAEGFKIVSGGGLGGTAALSVKRTDPKQYTYQMLLVVQAPAPAYRFGCYIKLDPAVGDANTSAGMFAQYYGKKPGSNKEEFLGGADVIAHQRSDQWQYFSNIVKTPQGADRIEIGVFIPRGQIGQAEFALPAVSLYTPPAPGNLIENGDFEGRIVEILPAGFSTELAGVGGTTALRYTRTKAADYKFFILKHWPTAPGKSYILTGKVKQAADPAAKSPAGLFIQYFVKKADGSMAWKDCINVLSSGHTGNWETLRQEFTIPANIVEVEVGTYIPQGQVGSYLLDDVDVREKHSATFQLERE